MWRCVLFLIFISIVLFFPNSVYAVPYIHLWMFGRPIALQWHKNLLTIGTSIGYILVFDANGNLKWRYKAGSWLGVLLGAIVVCLQLEAGMIMFMFLMLMAV